MDKFLAEGLKDEEKPVLAFLINDDFKGLFDFAKEYGYQESPYGYFSKCHLCVDIRKHLNVKHEFKELRPKEFYSHLG